MIDINKKNKMFLKYLLAFIVIVLIIAFMHVSGTEAQWPFWGVNDPWYYSMPSLDSPFLPFGQIPAYPYNNNLYFAYNSFLTPGLPLSSGYYYNNLINYANPYSQSWFDNSDYRSRSNTPGYIDFQPPPLGTPGYTDWSSYGYDVPLPWRYGFGPPLNIQRPEREPIDITSGITRWVQLPEMLDLD